MIAWKIVLVGSVMGVPVMVRDAWRYLRSHCWICGLPGGGRGGPIYWFQRWHLHRQTRA